MARNTSTAFKNQIKGTREFCVKIIITYADGTNETITDLGKFMRIKFVDECSGASEFEIGATIINEAIITLNNRDGDFTNKNFYGAKITVYAGIKVDDAPELLKMGTYIVDEPVSPGVTIQITAYDNMIFLDKIYEPEIIYPATLAQIAMDICEQCGVVLASTDFSQADYVINTISEDGQTCREILSAITQISGGFARVNTDGEIEIRWYAEEASHTIDVLKSKTICTDDVIITGINIYNGSDIIAQAGADGYRLSIKDNLLLETGKEQELADYLAGKMVGLTFRPLSISCKSDMSIEAGDKILVSDGKGNFYSTLVTSTTFSVLDNQAISCNAVSPVVNSSKRLSESAKAIIESKRYTVEKVVEERNAREIAIANLADRLATSSGLYITSEIQEDGSTIYYMHNKINLSDSDIIWKLTAEAFGISTDGGKTYPYILDVSGTAVLNRIYTVGLDASYINTGTLTARDSDGNIIFSVNVETGEIVMNASSIKMGSNQTVEEAIQGNTKAIVEAESNANKATDNKLSNYSTTAQVEALIKIEADKIALKVSANEVESMIEQKASSIRLRADKISWSSTYSSMTADGKLTCQSASILGDFETQQAYGDSHKITKLISGVLEGYYGDVQHGLLDLSAVYTDGLRHISLKGFDYLHLQAGTEIQAEQHMSLLSVPYISSGRQLVLGEGNVISELSSSSRRYKDHVCDMIDDDVKALFNTPVVWFKYKDGYLSDSDRFVGKAMPGFYAEDVLAALPEAVSYRNGEVEDWNYRILIPAMEKQIQILYKEILELKNGVTE